MNKDKKNSYWATKPFWCQPWTIISFGVFFLIFTWKVFDNLILTSIVGLFIFSWWVLFLILAPNAYQLDNDK